MPTLVLSPRHNSDDQALWRAAIELGWSIHRLTSWRVPEDLKIESPVLYLEPLVAPTIAEYFGKEFLEPPDNWMVELPYQYKHRNISLMTIAEVRNLPFPFFVKPPNNKSHKAIVVQSNSDLEQYLEEDYQVLVSDIVHWKKEFRCFALDGKVTTVSIYLRDGIPQRANDFHATEKELSDATEFANSVLAKNLTPNPIVIDVGVIEDEKWAVVEINAVWGCGIYACDPKKVLEMLSRF